MSLDLVGFLLKSRVGRRPVGLFSTVLGVWCESKAFRPRRGGRQTCECMRSAAREEGRSTRPERKPSELERRDPEDVPTRPAYWVSFKHSSSPF